MSGPQSSARSAPVPVPKPTGSSGTSPTSKALLLTPPKLRKSRPISWSTVSPPLILSSSPPPSSSVPTTSPANLTNINRPSESHVAKTDTLFSPFRDRSRSKSPGGVSFIGGVWKKEPSQDSKDPADSTLKSWWIHHHVQDIVSIPWKDSGQQAGKQTEEWTHTRKRVAQAVASVLGIAGDIAHEALYLGVDLLQFAPVPGLVGAGRTLLNIWDSVQLVNTNRLQCLRLTERCAEILLSVRQEVQEAGNEVGQELTIPYQNLLEAFDQVHDLMAKQARRPWIKRYLKRDEILGLFSKSDAKLTEALGMFSLSVQIRILKQVQENEGHRQEDTNRLIDSLIRSGAISPDYVGPPSVLGALRARRENALQLSGVEMTQERADLDGPLSSSPKRFPLTPRGTVSSHPASPVPHPAEVLSTLCILHDIQNTRDAARDLADLRSSMRAAMQTGSDAELCAVLQVARQEMPEALKTLQRELERIVEEEGREGSMEQGGMEEDAVLLDDKDKERMVGILGLMKRRRTTVSTKSNVHSRRGSGDSDGWSRDTLHREFIESGIDALRRASAGVDPASLPSWTITRYEVDREKVIGFGFFSDVYRGTWNGRTVAIKVLANTTPRELFKHEVAIWATLQHPHVLKLCGASSAAGDPPWFFVAPYQQNGNLAQYLQRIEAGWSAATSENVNASNFSDRGRRRENLSVAGFPRSSPGRNYTPKFPVRGSPNWNFTQGRSLEDNHGVARTTGEPVPREWDIYRFMHEIAKGMAYLHENEVLHDDLKGANVLIDDNLHCVISDFGQSEMKSKAYSISGKQPPHGTLRWQAPELMAGLQRHTTEMDVYAYAMTCVEILSMGRVPWALVDDNAVQRFVLYTHTRPVIPASLFNTPPVQELLRGCWHNDPAMRPTFQEIVLEVRLLRQNFGSIEESVEYLPGPEPSANHLLLPSPDMRPSLTTPTGNLPLPALGTLPSSTTIDTASTSFYTALDASYTTSTLSLIEEIVSFSPIQKPELAHYTPNVPSIASTEAISPPHTSNVPPSSRALSFFTDASSELSTVDGTEVPAYDSYPRSPPVDERAANKKNEQRYRILLTHQFHQSLTLPLWDPTPVDLGAVGYLSKPSGTFITLFNAFHPDQSTNNTVKDMPSLYGYGRVTTGSQSREERNAAQRGIDAFVGMLAFKGRGGLPISQRVSRRYSFPLRAGHKAAYICIEKMVYDYMDNLDAPKRWFMANVNTILQTFGAEHQIQREDLYLVVGTLKTPNYALFVSHRHPNGQAHFNVFSSQKSDQPWGTFTTDTEVPRSPAGPTYNEPNPAHAVSASKVSSCRGPWDTVLIARLRFKPDVLEPTSLL